MNPIQHEQLASLMERLNSVQQRMSSVKNMFPNHYSELQRRYNQMLTEARDARIVPPWMLG
jgi:hypothetical protein